MATREQSGRGAVTGAVLLVAALAWLPYLWLPSNPLIYDATMAVRHNAAVQGDSLARLFAVDFWGLDPDAAASTRSYRPLVSLTYWAQARFVGNSPGVYHAVDMALHAIVAGLVTLMLGRLGVRRPWLVPAGLVYAWHPLLTDAVCGIVGRADIMASGAFAGALVLHLDARTARHPAARRAGAVLCIGAAMLMKEYAVVFPFLLIAIDLARQAAGESSTALGRGRPVWVGALVALAAYLVLRLALFGALGGVPMLDRNDHPLFGASTSVRWSTAATFVPLALRLIVAPFGLNHHYRMGTLPIADGPLDPRALAGALAVAALIAFAVWGCLRARSAAPAIASAMFLLPLAPSLNTVSLAGVTFAERYLVLAVAGAALLVGRGLQRLAGGAGADARRAALAGGPAARRALLGATVVLALAGAFLTARRVSDWSSLERLARSSLASYPGGNEVWRQLGAALQSDRRHDEAADAFARALDLHENDAQTWKHYADSLGALGRHDEAVKAWQRTTELSPRRVWRLWMWRGDAERRAGRPIEAARSYAVALESAPNAEGAQRGLAAALSEAHAAALAAEQAGRHDQAESLFRELLALRPQSASTWFNLGRLLGDTGRPADAVRALRRGLALRDDPRARELIRQLETR